MHSATVWKTAQRPNYGTNIDKLFPYSEVPYLGDYNLIKIPNSLNNLIAHVDYWGEGKIVSSDGTSGFSNCYNINHQYQLVSQGPDLDRKIPNRIPVLSYDDCDTSSYIKDNSVLTVTVKLTPLYGSCAEDIARMVNNDFGKVVCYGPTDNAVEAQIHNLTVELAKKNIFYCPGYTLPSELQGGISCDNYKALLNISNIKDELTKNITHESYDNAVELMGSLKNNEDGLVVINKIVMQLINTNARNIMSLAYKLWQAGLSEVIACFPEPQTFMAICKSYDVKIINYQYRQALKLDANTDSYNDRLAWGDSSDTTSYRVSWKLKPVWENNSVTFKLYNNDCDMYLKLGVNVDNIGDRKAWGSTQSNELRHKYYIEPSFKNGTLAFYIINCRYNQGLKLAVSKDGDGDRLLWGHNGNIYDGTERYQWLILKF